MTETIPIAPTDVDPMTQGRVEWLPERHFRAEDAGALWFHDLLHNGPPSTPMAASLHHWPRGTKYASEFLQFPFSRGFDYILFYGRIYPGPLPITDPAEVQARRPRFQEKMADLLENWPERYQEMIDEWTSMLSYLRGIRKDVLPLDKLLMVLRDAVSISKRSWELHFVGMYTEIVAYQTFEDVCAKNGIEERQMRTFLQGFETKMYEIDRGMWWLADLAGQLGLTETFIGSDTMVDLYARLKESDKGAVWTDEFDLFLKKFGRRTTAALFDPYYPTWLEDPFPALSTIRTYVQKGGFDYEEHTRGIIEERDQYIEETLARITDPERPRRVRDGPAPRAEHVSVQRGPQLLRGAVDLRGVALRHRGVWPAAAAVRDHRGRRRRVLPHGRRIGRHPGRADGRRVHGHR